MPQSLPIGVLDDYVDPALLTDTSHRIVGCNHKAMLLLGVDGEALQGQLLSTVLTWQEPGTFGVPQRASLRGPHGEQRGLLDVVATRLHHAGQPYRLHICYPVADSAGQAEAELRRANRALWTLSAVNQVLVRSETEQILFEQVCQILVELGGYRMAWLGTADPAHLWRVRPSIWAGVNDGYLDSLEITWNDDAQGHGPVGQALRTRQPVVVRDVRADPGLAGLADAMLRRGYAAMSSFPLLVGDTTFGVLVIYASDTDAFDDQEVDLLRKLADDLVYGIESLRHRAERARAEQALRESEAAYRRLLETTEEGVWIIDADSRTTYVNPRMAEILGTTAEQMLGRSMFDFTDDESRRLAESNVQRRQAGIREQHEFTFRRSDGTPVWTLLSTTPNLDSAGKYQGATALVTDISERVRAEAALRMSEQRFASAFRNSPDGLAITTFAEGRYIEVNDAFLHETGYTREELLGRTSLELNLWEDQGDRSLFQKQMRQYGFIRDQEMSCRTKSGALCRLMVSVEQIELDGQPCILSVVRNISERKRLINELNRERSFSDLVVDTTGALILVHDADGRIVRCNRACEQLTGLPASELVGRFPWETWLLQDDPLLTSVFYTAIPPDDLPIQRSADWLLPGGERRTITWSISVLPDEAGSVGHVVAVGMDITERLQTESALSESEARFRTLAETTTATILIVQDSAICYANPAATALTGYDQDQLRTIPVWSLIEPFQLGDLKTHSGLDISSVPLISHQLRIRVRDGELRWCELTFGHITHQGLPAFLITAFDTTAHKLSEQALSEERALLAQRVAERTADLQLANGQLARAARLKDEFLANMSHELRTPLNSILGLSEALLEEVYGPLTERQGRTVVGVLESGQHLLELINDILDLSKIEAGRMDLLIAPVEVAGLSEAALRMVRQAALARQLSVSLRVSPAQPLIDADERRLKQILVNLLSNAVKFTPERGEIGLDVEPDPSGAAIRFGVWDTGIGIAEEDMGQLFRPFVQIDSGLTRSYEGTGLGLALVARLAALHGGGVQVESSPGKGSRFTVVLPIQHPATQQAVQAALPASPAAERSVPPGSPTGGAKLLLVEDNQSNIDTLRTYLEAHGYQIAIAHSGAEALQMARKQPPELVLTDIQMPGMDGLETIRRMRAEPSLAALPIIALTALAMTGDRERCLAAGADDYLSKPVSLRDLVGTVAGWLKRGLS
ncbi:MAG TPA: PAS domain S-box protein [Roseiflexaceae bacterium]|nr:PAS domain S-box protein [Roseiflexaceae bacterium]